MKMCKELHELLEDRYDKPNVKPGPKTSKKPPSPKINPPPSPKMSNASSSPKISEESSSPKMSNASSSPKIDQPSSPNVSNASSSPKISEKSSSPKISKVKSYDSSMNNCIKKYRNEELKKYIDEFNLPKTLKNKKSNMCEELHTLIQDRAKLNDIKRGPQIKTNYHNNYNGIDSNSDINNGYNKCVKTCKEKHIKPSINGVSNDNTIVPPILNDLPKKESMENCMDKFETVELKKLIDTHNKPKSSKNKKKSMCNELHNIIPTRNNFPNIKRGPKTQNTLYPPKLSPPKLSSSSSNSSPPPPPNSSSSNSSSSNSSSSNSSSKSSQPPKSSSSSKSSQPPKSSSSSKSSQPPKSSSSKSSQPPKSSSSKSSQPPKSSSSSKSSQPPKSSSSSKSSQPPKSSSSSKSSQPPNSSSSNSSQPPKSSSSPKKTYKKVVCNESDMYDEFNICDEYYKDFDK
jgi:hypothetical protein